MPVAGDFTLEARVAGHYRAIYDQAGLMLRVDERTWLRCGLVLSEGIGHVTVVVTRDSSDWSTIPGVTAKSPVWWRMIRKRDAVQVLYSVDGHNYTAARVAPLNLPAIVGVGLMCASPEGAGFECTFDYFGLQV